MKTDTTPTRVNIYDVDTAPEGSTDALKGLTEKYGQTLNIFGAMAESPTVLNSFAAFERTITDNTKLDTKTREAIHLTVSQVNECSYCTGAYTMGAKAAGWSEDETLAIRRGEVDGDAELTALLTLVRRIATDKGIVDDATWKAAIDAGWTSTELLDAYADTLRTLFTNYFNHFVHTDQDVPTAPSL